MTFYSITHVFLHAFLSLCVLEGVAAVSVAVLLALSLGRVDLLGEAAAAVLLGAVVDLDHVHLLDLTVWGLRRKTVDFFSIANTIFCGKVLSFGLSQSSPGST